MATFERTLEPVAGRSTLTLVQGATALATWIVRYAHLALVAGAAALGLVILWPQTTPVAYVNDSSVHLAMVRWATQQISDGHIPLDGWYPYLSLGSAEFHHYQVLAHIVTAYVGMVVGATTAFNWSLYLLLALWPISVYAGTRMLGWEPWVAAVAALMSPVLVSASNFGFEHQAYTWQGYGVWTQLWGMFFFPLAVGLGWRAVEGRGSLALAALLLGITLASHFVVGYLAGLVVGIFVVVRPLEIPRRLLRAVAVGIGGLAVASWEIVPL